MAQTLPDHILTTGTLHPHLLGTLELLLISRVHHDGLAIVSSCALLQVCIHPVPKRFRIFPWIFRRVATAYPPRVFPVSSALLCIFLTWRGCKDHGTADFHQYADLQEDHLKVDSGISRDLADKRRLLPPLYYHQALRFTAIENKGAALCGLK